MAEDSLDHADPFDPADVQKAVVTEQTLSSNAISAQQAALRARREAYNRVFRGNAMFGDIDIVMGDLKRFCRGNGTPWDADPRVHALLTGRFEVYTRIIQHVNLSFDDLWELYSGGIGSE